MGGLVLVVSILLTMTGGITPAGADEAQLLEVTTTKDGIASGSLRSQLLIASLWSLADQEVIVQLQPGSAYVLDSCSHGALDLLTGDANITILGNNSTIQQKCSDRVLDIAAWGAGEVYILGTKLTGGKTSGAGGGINFHKGSTDPGRLVLWSSPVVANAAGVGDGVMQAGGGVYSRGAVELFYSDVTSNSADNGGGVFADGITARYSKIRYNKASLFGGGLATDFGPVVIEKSTVAWNTGSSAGGGVFGQGPVSIENSTISNNTAGAGGGVAGWGDIVLKNSTVSTNLATGGMGGGVGMLSGELTTVYATIVNNTAISPAAGANVGGAGFVEWLSIHSVVAGGVGSSDCVLTDSSVNASLNFDGDGSCGFDPKYNLAKGGNPQLGALTNNGGPTFTHKPSSQSPLVDAVTPAGWFCTGKDQRGYSRPLGAGCDIGSVER